MILNEPHATRKLNVEVASGLFSDKLDGDESDEVHTIGPEETDRYVWANYVAKLDLPFKKMKKNSWN